MTILISALEVGKCYLTNTGRVWRIVGLMDDGRVLYEHRPGNLHQAKRWKPGMLTGSQAELIIEREVPCDWAPETRGA